MFGFKKKENNSNNEALAEIREKLSSDNKSENALLDDSLLMDSDDDFLLNDEVRNDNGQANSSESKDDLIESDNSSDFQISQDSVNDLNQTIENSSIIEAENDEEFEDSLLENEDDLLEDDNKLTENKKEEFFQEEQVVEKIEPKEEVAVPKIETVTHENSVHVSKNVAKEARSSIENLMETVKNQIIEKQISNNSMSQKTMDQFLFEMIEPKVISFLEKNLSKIVNDIVEREIKSIVHENK